MALPPKSVAKLGTSGAKANIDATPEPITILKPVIIVDTITPTTSAEIARPWIAVTNSFTIPREVNPKANVSPATISVTVLANWSPMPLKKVWILAAILRKSR